MLLIFHLDDVLAGINKLIMNRKVNSEGEKAGEEGGLNPSIKFCPSIKKVVFKKINSHRKRRARKADERL